MSASGTVQYRVAVGKRLPDVVSGPDDADVVVTVPLADVGEEPTVLYMQGRLKAVGHTGVLFSVLESGEAAEQLVALAATLGTPPA